MMDLATWWYLDRVPLTMWVRCNEVCRVPLPQVSVPYWHARLASAKGALCHHQQPNSPSSLRPANLAQLPNLSLRLSASATVIDLCFF